MAVPDGLMLFTVMLMGAPLFIPERIFAKVQGVATLVVSLLALTGSITGTFLTFALLILMVALFTAFPFGTIVYLIIWGSFDRSGAIHIWRSLHFQTHGGGGLLEVPIQRLRLR